MNVTAAGLKTFLAILGAAILSSGGAGGINWALTEHRLAKSEKTAEENSAAIKDLNDDAIMQRARLDFYQARLQSQETVTRLLQDQLINELREIARQQAAMNERLARIEEQNKKASP